MSRSLLRYLLALGALIGWMQTRGALPLSDTCQPLADTSRVVVGNIIFQGNQITKDRIVLRELVFHQGDTLTLKVLGEKMKQSRQNLLNRSIFNFVEMDTIFKPGTGLCVVDVRISMLERWYIWPMPILELADRNLNSWWETKDFRKINAGFFLTYDNFRGRLEKLKLLLRAGYDQNYYLEYEIPYLNRAQNFGIGLQLGHSRSREIAYLTEQNKQRFFRSEEGYARTEWYARVKMILRRNIHNTHEFSIGYEDTKFSDSALTLNPNFLDDVSGRFHAVHLNYFFKHDFRDSKPYPLSGHYADIELHQYGLGLTADDRSISTAKFTFDIYRPISRRWFWAANLTAKTANRGFQPYFLQRGLGYGNDFVRSFEVFVVDGQSFALAKSNLKFALVTPRKTKLPLIKSEKFSKLHYAAYLNLLLDAGYVNQRNPEPLNNMQNTWLVGTGLGLDVVTYYDIVWRFECTVNRYQKPGFFVHFVAPI